MGKPNRKICKQYRPATIVPSKDIQTWEVKTQKFTHTRLAHIRVTCAKWMVPGLRLPWQK